MITIELTIPELVKLISICNMAIAEDEAYLKGNHDTASSEMTNNSLKIIYGLKTKFKTAAIERNNNEALGSEN